MAKYPWYLSNLVAFIRLNIFVKISLQNWLDEPFVDPEPPPENNRQGVLLKKQKTSRISINTLNFYCLKII